MRKPLITMLVGVIVFAGCSHANSTMPHPLGNSPRNLTHGSMSPVSSPTRYVVLHRFQGGADGTEPHAGLVRDTAGNLYGTTYRGGTGTCPRGCGVVFKVDPSGSESVLHSFNGTDGKRPTADLILDAAGNLYGTTMWGGPAFFGVVFKLDPSGNETVLHGFKSGDGGNPNAALVRDAAGNLYGSEEFGAGAGTVFKVDPTDNESVIFSFNKTDGFVPRSRLLRDTAGNLYGTTEGGGTSGNCGVEGCGVVFKLDPSGNETVLHNFNGADGANPDAGVLLDAAGNLYGTTHRGGSSNCTQSLGCGVVFKVDPSGNETVLFRFKGKAGEHPVAELVRDSDGDLFGTTEGGGSLGFGVVFKLDPSGNETVLHVFNSSDGGPLGGLVRDSAGNLYGTALYNSVNGVVFELTH